jgi:hypothetical protein
MDQIVQVLGSLLVLTAFVAAQRRWLSPESRPYLWLNLVGAGVLAVLAAHERQFGFLLLEFCWAVAAGSALLRNPLSRARRPPRPRPASRTAAAPRRWPSARGGRRRPTARERGH